MRVMDTQSPDDVSVCAENRTLHAAGVLRQVAGLRPVEAREPVRDRRAEVLELARRYEIERRARAAAELAIAHATRLERVAAELAAALTVRQVADVVVTSAIASAGADRGALHVLADGGSMLEVVHGRRAADAELAEGERPRFSVDLKLPSTDALHGLEPVFVESGSYIPLVVSERPLGVLALGVARPRGFSAAERSFVLALARLCAPALNRAQLYEAEHEGRRRLSRLVERLPEGVVSVDRRGRVEFASSAAKQMLRAAPPREGRPLPESWFGFFLRSFATSLFDLDARPVEAQVRGTDGHGVFELIGIPAAGQEAALIVVTDVSGREERRRAEREFVENAAHELRTPLAAITSAIERLQAGAREVPEKRDRFLGHIQRESVRLNRLTASLLILARAHTQATALSHEQIPVRELLDELVDGLDAKPGVEVRVGCPSDLVARGDRNLLEHALRNLASNAARHTTRGSICISACAVAGDSMTIEVSDTGCGIPPDEHSRLFDRFYRGSREEAHDGFGLGLPITREAVDALGGRVEIDSVPGEGTTARIVLPCVDAPVAA
jgi:signal transduction histidine kinase